MEIVALGNELGKKAMVNSYHHWGITIAGLAPPLEPFAISDGMVEGFYHPTLPIVGIVWHPERKSPDEMFNEKVMKYFTKF